MIPLPAAQEVRETLLDYLRCTWQIADRDLEAALLAFLSGPQGMFKGPWVRLSLPFALAPEGAPMPLDEFDIFVNSLGPQQVRRVTKNDAAFEKQLVRKSET